MIQSLIKYFRYPVVEETSSVLLASIKPPLLYVCEDDQFNFDASRSYGYKFQRDYLSGAIQGGNYSTWKSKYGNITYDQLRDAVYGESSSRYKTLTIFQDNLNLNLKDIFIFPFGYCKHVVSYDIQALFRISSKSKVSIVVVSPEVSSNIKLIYSPHSIITTGPSPYYPDLYQSIHAEVTFHQQDNLLHDGTQCIDYSKKDFGYGHCVDEELKLLMKSTFGCVPVWLHPYDGCEQEIPNNNNNTTEMKKKADDEGWRLVTNHRLQVMEQCEESCTLTTTTIEIISIRDNFPGMARLNLR